MHGAAADWRAHTGLELMLAVLTQLARDPAEVQPSHTLREPAGRTCQLDRQLSRSLVGAVRCFLHLSTMAPGAAAIDGL